MFRNTQPVVDADFRDRDRELARLISFVDDLTVRKAPRWVAILGQRKVGKTSLLHELERRVRRPGLAFVGMDLFERLPISAEVFRVAAFRAIDALVGGEVGLSVERIAHRPEYASRVLSAPSVASLPSVTRDQIAQLPSMKLDSGGVSACLDLPERMACALDRHVVVVWDEFQELASLSGTRLPDLLGQMRSAWQRHTRVAYLISGSAPSMLREMISSSHSPFFLHFDVMELGAMSEPDAISLVRMASEGALDEVIARRIYAAVGGHPFYLQVLGEELLRLGSPFDDDALKDSLQRVLFSSTGRLSLYFAGQYASIVGRSAFAAAAVAALAEASTVGLRLADVAHAISAPAGDTSRYLERLGDAVIRNDQKRYQLVDPTFALWVRWREPGGRSVPMSILGDEGERQVAEQLCRMGFDLVYQSRASRGAFDLLATRGVHQLGIQVKRSGLPLSFTRAEWGRMEAESRRFGWRWVVAAVEPALGVVFLDPVAARIQRSARLHPDAAIPNLLLWLERA